MQLLQPHPGWVELDPLVLWEQFVDVITEVIEGTQTSQSTIIIINECTNNNSIFTVCSFRHYDKFEYNTEFKVSELIKSDFLDDGSGNVFIYGSSR